MAILPTSQPHEPWNKGKLIGQKAPLKLKDIWAIGFGFNSAIRFVTLPCSIWRLIPSFGLAIW